MVREICRDVLLLQKKAVPATQNDLAVVDDLLDTLRANADRCVGMAANMIGKPIALIALSVGPFQIAMINPKITKRKGKYETEEGCLSLTGVRPAIRYEEIEVEYLDRNFKRQKGSYKGWTAQIIQHECDHLMGIII